MCGIHGVISTAKTTDVRVGQYIEDAFVVNSLRGKDSSGILQISKEHKAFMFKEATAGPDFVGKASVKPFLSDAGNAIITVCHVRAATRGNVNTKNAHPFVVGIPNTSDKGPDGKSNARIIGVHNGTLYVPYSKAKDYDVDSEWAFNRIAAEGADAFEEFNGAYCFVWWDEREPGMLFMARNDERPMHFVLNKDKNRMFFGSEAGMVDWLTDRRKIACEDEVYSLESGKMYKFDLTGETISYTKSQLPAYKNTYVGTSGAGYSRYYGYDDGWEYMEDGDGWWERRYQGIGTTGYTRRESRGVVDRFPAEGERVVKAIAEIMAGARGQSVNKEALADSGVASAEVPWDDEGLPEGLGLVTSTNSDLILPDSFYAATTSTAEEKNRCKALGVFGELQFFQGVVYDPDTCEVWGEIEDFIPGSGKVKYNAVLRNTTASRADRCFINNRNKDGRPGDWCAIIGVTSDPQLGKVFVVSELTADGKKKMFAKAS